MADIIVPTLGESVTEATVSKWFKQPGDAVKADEPLCELETDKVTVEVPSPAAGVLKEQSVKEGATVGVGAKLGVVEAGAAGAKTAPVAAKKEEAKAPEKPTPAAPAAKDNNQVAPKVGADKNGPAASKMLAENPQVKITEGSGKDGRVTKGDVITALEGDGMSSAPAAGPREERVKMTKLRQTIARRLKESQNTAAILTGPPKRVVQASTAGPGVRRGIEVIRGAQAAPQTP